MYKLNYKNTNFTILSDTHGKHRNITIEPCDILIHLGDICNFGDKQEMDDFFEWYTLQDALIKIIVPGNHDVEFAKGIDAFEAMIPQGITLLDNCKAAIWIPGDDTDEIGLTTVPVRMQSVGKDWVDLEYTDILLTHCPPYGILDGRNHYGSHRLLEHVTQYKPEYHIFGHVHLPEPCETTINNTTFINVTRKY